MTRAAPYLPPGLPRPVPETDGLDRAYWDGTRAGELRVQRCRACRAFQWGPEWICHACLSFELAWVAVEPRGRIYSWERVWHPVHRALGLRELGEDGDRALAHGRCQWGSLKPRADVGKMAGWLARVDGRYLDHDAMAGEHAVIVADQLRPPAVRQSGRAHGGEGLFGELGMGIEQRGEKHVSRQAAERVEMHMPALPHAQAAGRYTGTT